MLGLQGRQGPGVKARAWLDAIHEGGEDMDNRQALGYMFLALKQLGYSKEEAKKIYREMYYCFDVYTEEEAEEKGFEWYRSLKD
jgi:Holliday junction resolvasome RuvABC DNA-binding subunit